MFVANAVSALAVLLEQCPRTFSYDVVANAVTAFAAYSDHCLLWQKGDVSSTL